MSELNEIHTLWDTYEHERAILKTELHTCRLFK